MNTISLRSRWHFIWPAVLVVVMFVSVIGILMYAMIGGNPYAAQLPTVTDALGQARTAYHPGEWIYINREICSDQDIITEQSATLFDTSRNAAIPVIRMLIPSAKGCGTRGIAFPLPAGLPPGKYEYRNTVRFQNNLIGRDESTTFPPIQIEVLP